MSKALSMREWYDGMKSPGGALAKPGDSKGEVIGHAIGNTLTAVGVGAAVGAAESLLGEGVSDKQLVAASGVATVASVLYASKPIGRVLANVGMITMGMAARDYFGGKVAHHAGTTKNVLSNKAKAIAAHGDAGSLNAGEDPLVAAGTRIFGSGG